MRRNGFTLVEFVVVVAIIGILAALLYPIFWRTHGTNERRPVCLSNLKKISLGFKQYIQDNNDKFPPLAVARSGYWAGSLQPYARTWQVFQCPSAGEDEPKTTDYFYNSRLAQVDKKNLDFSAQTILAGDGTNNSPTSYALSDLPPAWRQNAVTPATRHLEGANYAFADGHVKWLKPEDVTAQSPNNSNFTFALR